MTVTNIDTTATSECAGRARTNSDLSTDQSFNPIDAYKNEDGDFGELNEEILSHLCGFEHMSEDDSSYVE